jgi:hypothetical protein
MNVLDENIVVAQREMLRRWNVRFSRIGEEFGRAGMGDDEIVPLLHYIGNVTFFTGDGDFFDPRLRHPKCCFVWLHVATQDIAAFILRFLKHPKMKTRKQRLGKVIRVAPVGLFVWAPKAARSTFIPW